MPDFKIEVITAEAEAKGLQTESYFYTGGGYAPPALCGQIYRVHIRPDIYVDLTDSEELSGWTLHCPVDHRESILADDVLDLIAKI